MNLYLDDDSVEALLVRLLVRAGHDVIIPADIGHSGSNDPVHLAEAIQRGRVLLSKNHDDFHELDELIRSASGRHPGILIVRQENDPKRDMRASRIVRAIANLEAANAPVANEFIILNHWR